MSCNVLLEWVSKYCIIEEMSEKGLSVAISPYVKNVALARPVGEDCIYSHGLYIIGVMTACFSSPFSVSSSCNYKYISLFLFLLLQYRFLLTLTRFLGIIFATTSLHFEPLREEFNADHPFLFYLLSRDTEQEINVLFGGRVNKPALQ